VGSSRVAAFGKNGADVARRKGDYFPFYSASALIFFDLLND